MPKEKVTAKNTIYIIHSASWENFKQSLCKLKNWLYFNWAALQEKKYFSIRGLNSTSKSKQTWKHTNFSAKVYCYATYMRTGLFCMLIFVIYQRRKQLPVQWKLIFSCCACCFNEGMVETESLDEGEQLEENSWSQRSSNWDRELGACTVFICRHGQTIFTLIFRFGLLFIFLIHVTKPIQYLHVITYAVPLVSVGNSFLEVTTFPHQLG